MKLKKIVANSLIALVLLSTGTLIGNNKVEAANTDADKFYTWHQTDMPWATNFGGTTPGQNYGCYVTSTAIQAARSGITKKNDGSAFNPSVYNTGYGGSPVSGKDDSGKSYTFAKKVDYPSSHADFQSATAMGAGAAEKALKAITKQGLYPIIHVDAASGEPSSFGTTHYVAYRGTDKSGNIQLYDPARSKDYDIISAFGSQAKFKAGIAYIEGWGSGPKKFSDAPSTAPTDGSSKGDVDNSSNDGGYSGGNSSAPRIKPIFNPFITHTESANNLGYDVESRNTSTTRAELLAFADGTGNTVLTWVQVLAQILLYIYIAFSILAYLLYITDDMLGGILSDKISQSKSSFAKAIFFPNNSGDFLGIKANGGRKYGTALKSNLIGLAFFSAISLLISTRTLSIILGNSFFWMSKAPEFFANLMH